MPHLAWFVAVPLSLAALHTRAEVTGVSTRAQLSLAVAPEEHACAGVFAPQPWRDASDPLFFVTSPTARLDQHEMWSGVLAPLVSVHYLAGTLRLVLIGTPTQTRIRFTRLGWRPRWPFC